MVLCLAIHCPADRGSKPPRWPRRSPADVCGLDSSRPRLLTSIIFLNNSNPSPAGYPNRQNFYLHYGDMTDLHALVGIIRDVRPTECYNLAAQSHVQVSFQMPMYTAEVDGVGTLNLLEAIRLSGQAKTCRFYQASTSELYGKVQAIPQDEDTPFYPRSPYAVAKMMAFWAVVNYRESYDMYACNGAGLSQLQIRSLPVCLPIQAEVIIHPRHTRLTLGISHTQAFCSTTNPRDAAKSSW